MTPVVLIVSAVLIAVLAVFKYVIVPLYLSSLSQVPGPKIYALTKWRLAWDEWHGERTRGIHLLHQRYGPVVRIGPNEVHFNSPSALKTIYGAGSGFERTTFYRMFDVYGIDLGNNVCHYINSYISPGKQNVFTFGPTQLHAQRKKLLAHAYAKGSIIKGHVAQQIEARVADFVELIATTQSEGNEIFHSLHFYSLDNITNFLYGSKYGGTSALKGNEEHRKLLEDILDPARRQLTWFVVHFPVLTKWLYSQTGFMEGVVRPLLPMQKPSTYTRIRAHALKAMTDHKAAIEADKMADLQETTVIDRLWTHHEDRKTAGLGDLDIASECSDHFLAGIDTTSDTLMFLIWALSLPKNQMFQQKVIDEARQMQPEDLNEDGYPVVAAADRLPYLDAVIKETLRLYAPIPETEPRQLAEDIDIDGYMIPARTVVGMAPHSLHRNPDVFANPQDFNPDRWLGDPKDVTEMKRWWWAFSSGGRMCVGIHLAMAEMVALVPAVYRRYTTSIKLGFENISPGIISRFEVFYDETFQRVEEHTCWIQFEEH